MKKDTRHLGFDVDSEKIAVAVAEPGGEVRLVGAIANREESVRRLVNIRVINRRTSPSTAASSVPRDPHNGKHTNSMAHWT